MFHEAYKDQIIPILHKYFQRTETERTLLKLFYEVTVNLITARTKKLAGNYWPSLSGSLIQNTKQTKVIEKYIKTVISNLGLFQEC